MKKLPDSPGHHLLPFAVSLRRDFHMHPEIGLTEKRTQRVIREQLTGMKIRPKNLAGTGVVGQIGGRSGPVLMLRADMDALPVTEENDVPYASTEPGRMHACGHDAHMAILLSAARHLKEDGLPRGSVKLCFQPGEEGYNGAAKMIEAGVLDHPPVDGAFGLHVWRDLPVGKVAILDGPCMAAADMFEIVVTGKGGHAAYPHQAVDPVAIAAQVVTAIQTIVSREVEPLDPAVVTVASLQAGTAFNIIPDRAVLRGTCRTFRKATRKLVRKRVEQVAKGVARALGGRAEMEYEEFAPATVNDPAVAAIAREAAAAVVGEKNVVAAEPSMGGEDMSLYLEKVPGCFAFVGMRNERRGIVHPHHHPRFDIDERSLAVGTDLVIEFTRRWLASA
jgi:amidohydrolase